MLHLAKHAHTGKALPHHHTSYRGLILLLVVVGIALGSIQQAASAASDYMVVSAKVAAEIPTVKAVITTPTDGSTSATAHITVEGTCQYLTPASIIAINRGGHLLGSAVCQANGSFSLSVQLQNGINSLVARTSNSTGDYGPDSDPISVDYTPPPTTGGGITPGEDSAGNDGNSPNPVSPVSPVNPGETNQPGPAGPLLINSQETYLTFGKDTDAVWNFGLDGGNAPYSVKIDWGDGSGQDLTVRDGSLQTVRHSYNDYDSRFATITVTDVNGVTTTFSIAVFTPYVPLLFGPTQPVETPFIQTPQGSLVIAYGIYVATLGITGLAVVDAHIVAVQVAGVHFFPQHGGGSTQSTRAGRRGLGRGVRR